MDFIRSAIRYISHIKTNQIDHGDILAIKLAKTMGHLRLWWTEAEYKNTSKIDKFACFFVWAAYIAIFTGDFTSNYLVRNSLPLPVFLGNLSYYLVSLVAAYGMVLLHCKRAAFSRVLNDVNQTNWKLLRKSGHVKYRLQRNRIHLISIVIFLAGLVMGLMTVPALLLEFLVTGKDHFKNPFVSETQSFSISSIVNCMFNILVVTWFVTFYTLVYTIIVEIFLIISLNIRIMACGLTNIQIGNGEERVFKGLMKELHQLQCLIRRMNDILWSFWIPFTVLVLYTVGLHISVIITADSVMEDLSFITAPVYLLSYMVLFCSLGQHVKDSVAEVEEAAYNCDWYAAPIPFRKLILMLLIRCRRESKFEANPFFEMNFALLAKVLNSAYAIVAVVLNISR